MASCTRYMLFLGLVGFMSVIMLVLYQQDMLQVKTENIHQLQEQRQQQLREMCDSFKNDFPKWNRSSDEMTKWELSHFLMDNKHGIIYCYIPKVACTNWKRILFVLRRGEPYQDPETIGLGVVHQSKYISTLRSNEIIEMRAKLKHYTKFLFVRDPFIRLISAYRDKLERYNKPFYDRYGWFILKRYGNVPDPPMREKEVLASGARPSFYNFVQYLLDPRTPKPFDKHWRPMYQLCHPCIMKYDFIGHQETLQEDGDQLLKILKLDNDIKFPSANQNMATQDFLSAYFKPVPIEERRKLYQMYEKDFQLFGYPKPVELLDG